MPDPSSHDPQSLFDPVDAPLAVATVYISPSGAGKRGTRLIGIWVCNHTALDVAYTFYHVKSGGGAADSNKLYHARTIPAGATDILAEGIQLDPGDFLAHFAATASAISVHGYGFILED